MNRGTGMLSIRGVSKPGKTKRTILTLIIILICACVCLVIFSPSRTASPTPTQTLMVRNSPQPTATTTPTPANTETAVPSATSTPTQVVFKFPPCIPADATIQTARVVEIVDGDTIKVMMDGKEYTVRYIGMDTPEIHNGIEPLGQEAAQKNSDLVMGKEVTLIKDTSETDIYSRLLRYVFVGNLFVNQELVSLGYAEAKRYPPDTRCNDEFSVNQAVAKMDGLGLWAIQPTLTVPVRAASGSCPQGCLQSSLSCTIKGNINSKGDKIYHVPGSHDYERTKIDPSKGERWFCTVDEATANGWRAPYN